MERKDILDKEILRDFKAVYEGINAGVDILKTRSTAGKGRKAGKTQYLLH